MDTFETGARPGGASDEALLFEALCIWRGLYAHRGPQDRTSVISIGEVIGSAELLLRSRHLRDQWILRRFAGG